MSFGSRLKEARLLRGLTQEALGELVGTSKAAIANYEAETSSPREDILIRLFNKLNVEPNYLYQDYIAERSSVPTIKLEITADEYDLLIAYRRTSVQIRQGICSLLGMKVANQQSDQKADDGSVGKKVVDIVSKAYSQREGTDGPQE